MSASLHPGPVELLISPVKNPCIYLVMEIVSQKNAAIVLLFSSYFPRNSNNIGEKCLRKRKKSCCRSISDCFSEHCPCLFGTLCLSSLGCGFIWQSLNDHISLTRYKLNTHNQYFTSSVYCPSTSYSTYIKKKSHGIFSPLFSGSTFYHLAWIIVLERKVTAFPGNSWALRIHR